MAVEVDPRGLFCLGYSFYPPDQPQNLRTVRFKTLELTQEGHIRTAAEAVAAFCRRLQPG